MKPMNDQTIENPTAFPTLSHDVWNRMEATNGMSLRDYFAAKAMAEMSAHPDTWGEDVPEIASTAYRIADAMLKARLAQ